MVLIADQVYSFWIGDKLKISFSLTAMMGLYTIIIARINIYGFFINSLGKLKVSTLFAYFTLLVNIPLLYFVMKYLNSSLIIIVLINSLVLLPNIILTKIQYNKLVGNSTSGIWFK
jgi:hypothetical protein